MAQLLSNTLYNKRFFPFYTFNLCAGLDEEGEWLASFVGRQGGGQGGREPGGRSRGAAGGRRVGTPLTLSPLIAVGCCSLCLAGRGAVYTYDAIGSYERKGFSCQGRRAPGRATGVGCAHRWLRAGRAGRLLSRQPGSGAPIC